MLGDQRAQRGEIDVPGRVRWHFHHPESGHAGGGRVRAVRRIGHQDGVALAFAPVVEVLPHDQHAGQLAVRAGSRLERHGGETGDLRQHRLKLEHQRHRALHAQLRLERMQRGEAGDARRHLVHLRVILHGARAERVEAGVDAVVQLRQAHVVAHQVDLGHLGHRQIGALAACRQRRLWHIAIGEADGAAARLADIVDQWLRHWPPPHRHHSDPGSCRRFRRAPQPAARSASGYSSR